MFRFLTNDLRRNLIKIACLTLGLALGFILAAKIYVEASYDSSHPDSEELYFIKESLTTSEGYKDYSSTPGAVGPGMKEYSPLVASGTRLNYLAGESSIRLNDGRVFEIEGLTMADSCFFDVMKRPILTGNPHDALSAINTVMIPKSLADKIGEDVIGMTFTVPELSEKYTATIGGIYEDFPVNSTIKSDVYLSMSSLPQFRYDGRDNWLGNDQYFTLVRLLPGAKGEDLKPHIDRMLAEHIDNDVLTRYGFTFFAVPLTKYHRLDRSVTTMIWVMSLLAIIILVSAGLNFLLIVIGQMSRRQKEMAIRKCYGTSSSRIFGRIIFESLTFMIISLVLALLTVLSLSDYCVTLLGFSANEMLTAPGVWMVEAGLCIVLFILTGVVPARMYCRTPVINAFRNDTRTRRGWKLLLLFIQFFASALLSVLVMIVYQEYKLLSKSDPGYESENLAQLNLSGTSQAKRAEIIATLRDVPGIIGAATAEQDYTVKASGNNMWIDDPEVTVNLADMYGAEASVPEIVGMKFVQGRGFEEGMDSTINQVIVEERMIDVVRDIYGIEDENIIGLTFFLTEHWTPETGNLPLTIVGVVENMRRGGFNESISDDRPGVIFPTTHLGEYLYLRFDKMSTEHLQSAQKALDRVTPERDMYIVPMTTILDAQNSAIRNFGTSVGIAGLAILLITLTGLTAYTADEVNRRAKEIAIRKVNGTPVSGIIMIFVRDISRVAVPATVLGGIAAAITGTHWLAQFTLREDVSWWRIGICILIILAIILGVTISNSIRIARSNPVKFLRNE